MESRTKPKPRLRSDRVRTPVVADIFYPGSGPELSAEISSLVAGCGQSGQAARAIVSPHGSLPYSGRIAAAAWRATQGRRLDRLVVLSPAHRASDPAVYLPESTVFSIPGSSFSVDVEARAVLEDSITACVRDDIPHLEEHGVEMQLIFAAHFHPRALILPLIVSGSDSVMLRSLFSGLGRLLQPSLDTTLFVISSNMAVAKDGESCLAGTEAYIAWLSRHDRSGDKPAPAEGICGSALLEAFMASELAQGLGVRTLDRGSSAAFAEEGEPIVGYAALGLFP